MRELCELYTKGDLHSHVYKRYELKDANGALKTMREEKVYGKVLLCMSEWYCLLMSKEGNCREARVLVFEDPDEKHRRESVGRVLKERVCWMAGLMIVEEWEWREEECGWIQCEGSL